MNHPFREPALLLGFYVFSHLAWMQVLGAGFISYKLLDFSHFMNPEWLANDLFGSLLYLHAQPPLMNLIIGIIFKVAPEHYEAIFRSAYAIAGGSALLAINATMRMVQVSAAVRAAMFFFLLATPTFYMFGTWYYSTHLEFCLAAFLCYGLACFFLKPETRAKSIAGIFACCALLGLLRPQWHLGLFVLLAVVMAWRGGEMLQKKIMALSLIFLLPVGGWHLKNELLFDFFGASSWMGANVAQVAHKAGFRDVKQMKRNGTIATDFPADFVMPKVLRRIPPDMVAAANPHPAIGALKSEDVDFFAYASNKRAHYLLYNLNYLGMIASARQDMRDARAIIAAKPTEYVRIVLLQAYVMALTPSFFSPSLNLVNADAWVRGIISDPIAVFILLNMGALMLYLIIPTWMLYETVRAAPSPQRKFLLTCLGLMAIMTTTACAFNGYEQERMRWGWQPVYILVAALLLERVKRGIASLQSFTRRGF